MLTYVVRDRVYRCVDDQPLAFPNSVEVVFFFQPLQPFGKDPAGGRTAVKGVAASIRINANTGHHFVESEEPLRELEVVIEAPIRKMELRGNELHISTYCDSLKALDELVQSVFFGFPMLLNIEFADPPIVERVKGKVGDAPFRWELREWKMESHTTTQELQEQRVISSWLRFDTLSQPRNRRLLAALHYFHVACRLCRAGNSPWEFMSESIVNLSKILEVLFPPKGDGQTINAARKGLGRLGYTKDEIERDFTPAIALRNHIDSAHVHLSVFTREQLRILHTYTESAEFAFRSMLSRVFDKLKADQFELAQYPDLHPSPNAAEIINKLARHKK